LSSLLFDDDDDGCALLSGKMSLFRVGKLEKKWLEIGHYLRLLIDLYR